MTNKLKTVEEHKYYLEEIVKLSLWVTAKYCNEHPEKDIYNELDKRTPIFNHTQFNKFHMFDIEQPKPKEWFDMKNKLKELYISDNTPENFEKSGYKLIKPFIYGRVDFDMEDLYGVEEDEDESWIRYDIEKDSNRVELHFENSLYPKSFLSDKKHFYRKLDKCYQELKAKGIKNLYAGSWLNSYDKFLNLLPPQWKESRIVEKEDIEFHLGFWGQFFKSNEEFNEKSGTYLRKTGRVPFPEATCEMTVEELEEFLKTKKEYLL